MDNVLKHDSASTGAKRVYVFVYGTLKTGGGNNHLLRDSKSLGEAVTVGDNYTMRNGGFPMVVAEGISHVKGELFEVTDPEVLDDLDWLEGVPHHFDRHYTEFKVLNDEPMFDGEVYGGFMYTAAHENKHYVLQSTYKIVPDADNNLWWNHK